MSNLPILSPTEWNALCAAAAGPLNKYPLGYANDLGGPYYSPFVVSNLRGLKYLTHSGYTKKPVFKITSAGEDYIAARHVGLAHA